MIVNIIKQFVAVFVCSHIIKSGSFVCTGQIFFRPALGPVGIVHAIKKRNSTGVWDVNTKKLM